MVDVESCGGFDLNDLWAVDVAIAVDMLLVVQLIARRHDYPTAYGRGAAFERLVELWQAALFQANPMTVLTNEAATGSAASRIVFAPADAPDGNNTSHASPASALSSPAPLPFPIEELTLLQVLPLAVKAARAPVGEPPPRVSAWFDGAASADISEHDGTLCAARSTAQAYARRAKAESTSRAYRVGVHAWCDRHALSCLPARSADVVAFLAAEHGRGLSVNTVDLRRAAIRYLHFIFGLPVPTAETHVA